MQSNHSATTRFWLRAELVANAVLHAGCEPEDLIEMIAELDPSALRITVVDTARSGSTPMPCEGPITGVEGVGLTAGADARAGLGH